MRSVLTFWLLSALAACASHTMAWKVPLEALVPGGGGAPTCRALEKPPVASAFFKPGDELWDVVDTVEWVSDEGEPFDPFASQAKDPVRKAPDVEWLIWNATSGKLVARGSWAQLNKIERQLDLDSLPKLIRTTFEVQGDEPEPCRVTFLSRSGEESTVRDDLIELASTAHYCVDRQCVDATITASWKRGDDWTDGVEVSTTIPTRETLALASWKDAGGAWKARISCEVVTLNEVPVNHLKEVETPRGILRLDEPPLAIRGKITDERRAMADGLVAVSYPVPPDFIWRVSGDEGVDLPDLPDDKDGSVFPGRPWIDVREPLSMNGVRLSAPGATAGFHPYEGIITVVGTADDVDLVEQIVSPHPSPILFVEHVLELPDVRGMVLCRSGERVRIHRSSNGKSRRLLEIATNIGADDRLMDVSYAISLEEGPWLNSAVTMITGQTKEIARISHGEESKPIKLTGTVRTVGP